MHTQPVILSHLISSKSGPWQYDCLVIETPSLACSSVSSLANATEHTYKHCEAASGKVLVYIHYRDPFNELKNEPCCQEVLATSVSLLDV